MKEISFDFATLRDLYAGRGATIPEIAAIAWERGSRPQHAEAWIHRVPEVDLRAEAARLQTLLESDPEALKRWPLLGIPFAVKDNLDVAGVPTTAACPAYARMPAVSAPAVQKLLDAGALFLGKTNMDQFATGLVGTRSPYGATRNPFDPCYITGGSSSGSALAVSTGMASFALGTDTAGSGRVPAAFTNLVGLKPSRGRISTRGVVPACPSLDCVSVFALTAADAFDVLAVVEGFDAQDPYSRAIPANIPAGKSSFKFGVPLDGQLDFSGDEAYATLYARSRETMIALGGTEVPVDISPLLDTAPLLYQGPWLAERAEAIGRFADAPPQALLPLLEKILAPAQSMGAIETFRGMHALQALRRAAEPIWSAIDILLLPTTPTIFTHDQIAEEPLARNAILGRFTNFVNLMDLCAIALPAGFRPDGLPFGVSLLAPAFHDQRLEPIARAWEARHGFSAGATGLPVGRTSRPAADADDASRTRLLVFGLHLSGQPLNHELIDLGAELFATVRTAPRYRMALLKRGEKRLPGIWRQADTGVSLEGEIWSLPNEAVGAFFARVPAPLCLGSLELEDGSWVKGFLAEAVACEAAEDISRFGGWRGWLSGG